MKLFLTALFLTQISAFAASPSPQGAVEAENRAMEAKFQRLQLHMDSENGGAAPTAETTPTRSEARQPEPTSIISLSLQVFFGLVFVLVLAVLTLRLLKRLQRSGGFKPKGMESEFFQVLETCYIDSQHKVVALRMGPRMGIIGISPQSVSLIQEFSESPSELGFGTSSEGNAAAFSDSLNKVLDRFKKPKRVSDLLEEG